MEGLTSVPVFVRSEPLTSEKNRGFDLKSRSSMKEKYSFQRIAWNSQALVQAPP